MAPEGVGTSLGLFGSQVKDTRKLSKGEFVEWVSPLQPFWESTWKSVHPNGLTTRKDLAGVFIFWDAGSAQPKDASPWGNEASWAQQCGSMICYIKKKKVSRSLCPPDFAICLDVFFRKMHLWSGIRRSSCAGGNNLSPCSCFKLSLCCNAMQSSTNT